MQKIATEKKIVNEEVLQACQRSLTLKKKKKKNNKKKAAAKEEPKEE